jgi:hypothetical protein
MKNSKQFFILPHSVLLRMRNISEKNLEKITTYFMFKISPTPTPHENVAVDNVEEYGIPDRAHMTI